MTKQPPKQSKKLIIIGIIILILAIPINFLLVPLVAPLFCTESAYTTICTGFATPLAVTVVSVPLLLAIIILITIALAKK